jgi:predicted DNA binding CopG/RHH family protein
MYIRIQDNGVRYRISRDEASELLEGKPLIDHLCLSQDKQLSYQVLLTNKKNSFEFNQQENSFNLKIAKADIEKEISARPSKKGIRFCQTSNNITQDYSLEIDIKKSKPKVH